jgi:hypothetical protein
MFLVGKRAFDGFISRNRELNSFGARAASGHAAAAPPSSVMNSRRFTDQRLPCFRQNG